MAGFFTNETVSLEKKAGSSVEWKEEDRTDAIKECVKWILDNKYKKVCLQFPDELLKYSSDIASAIQDEVKETVYIMADCTYER